MNWFYTNLVNGSICLGYFEGALKPRLCDCLGRRIFTKFPSQPSTVEPRYNEGLRDWQNMFAVKRFRYIKVLFHNNIILLVEVIV